MCWLLNGKLAAKIRVVFYKKCWIFILKYFLGFNQAEFFFAIHLNTNYYCSKFLNTLLNPITLTVKLIVEGVIIQSPFTLPNYSCFSSMLAKNI